MSHAKKVLLQVGGSIAAFKAAALCSKLAQAGYEIEIVLSDAAEQFVGSATFEGLTRKLVHRGVFDEGRRMAHIDLMRWADIVLAYPASANTLSTLAQGRSDSLIGALFLAHRFDRPYWIAPAMNEAMWLHPATRRNTEILRSWGVEILEPAAGSLACGEVGSGRLIEPEEMFARIHTYFTSRAVGSKAVSRRVLVTAGGTREPIDAVRSITNTSTGETGYRIAEYLHREGMDVTLLTARTSPFQSEKFNTRTYTTSDDLDRLMHEELSNRAYDDLIHSAAVSDYRVSGIAGFERTGKIQSQESIQLTLVPNPKILRKVRAYSRNPQLRVVSFKLTAGETSDMKLDAYDSDWIVHNDIAGVRPDAHEGTLYRRSASGTYDAAKKFRTKDELAQVVAHILQGESP